MRAPRVTNNQLLDAFEDLCRVMGTTNRGFDYKAITAPISGAAYDGTEQWAMMYRDGMGWMVVGGIGGCGAALSRWNGYMRTRWDFMMMLEAVVWASTREEVENNG